MILLNSWMSHQSPFNLNKIVLWNFVNTEEKHRISALCRTKIQFIIQIVNSTLFKALHLLPEKRDGDETKILNSRNSQTTNMPSMARMHHHFMLQKEEKESKALPGIMGCHCNDYKMHADLKDVLVWTLVRVSLESMKYGRLQL